MGNRKYSYQHEDERTAKAFARSVRISSKEAYEVGNALRNLTLDRAKKFLANVIEQKEAVPYKRFNHGVPHRAEIGPGRYPRNTSQSFLKLLNEVEANAEAKGLNSSALKLIHVATQKARSNYGNFKGSRRESPNVHIEIVVQETAERQKDEKKKLQVGSKKESKSKDEKPKTNEKTETENEKQKAENKSIKEEKKK